MRVLLLGGSGATGSRVLRNLIERGIELRVFVREGAVLPVEAVPGPGLEIRRGQVADLDLDRWVDLLRGCDAVVSCLGHNLTFRGMFGWPRRLVADALYKIGEVVRANPDLRPKLVLMSTTACANREAGEVYPWSERFILGILNGLLPPHRDNVLAAQYLNREWRRGAQGMEWVAVRPDTLTNEDAGRPYELFASPQRSPIFKAGVTSRANVVRFMVDLLTDETLWREWAFKMPVVYNGK